MLDNAEISTNNMWLSVTKPVGLAMNIKDNTLYIVSKMDDDNSNKNTISIFDLNTYLDNLDYVRSFDFNIDESGIFSLAIDDNNIYSSNYDTGSIRQFENYVLQPFEPISDIISTNICFTKDTPILTDQGYIPICNIIPNVNTIRNTKIVDITKTKGIDEYLICFDKDAISIGCPTEKTIMTKDHKVFYNGTMKPAYTFLNKFEKVRKVKYNEELLYNILMETHTIIKANNMICETLSPNNLFAKLYTRQCKYTEEEKKRIIDLLNDSKKKNDYKRFKHITKNIK